MVSLYLVPFSGEILEATVTAKAYIIDYWFLINIQPLQGQNNIIGLNCKWTAMISSHPTCKISIMQFCVGTKCLIIQPSQMGTNFLQSLKSFLCDSSNIFVGVEVDEAVSKLKSEYGVEFGKSSVFDIRGLAEKRFPFSFWGKCGIKTLGYELVKLPVWTPKKVGHLTDFESLKLEKDQVKSACIDVFASFKIGWKLLN